MCEGAGGSWGARDFLLYEFIGNIYNDDEETKKTANPKDFDMFVSQIMPSFWFVYTNWQR